MRVVIAREPGVLRERLRQAVLGIGLQCGEADCVAPAELPARLIGAPADLVLVGLTSNPAAGLSVIEQAARHTSVPIFAVGSSADPGQILQTLRHGAREHLHEEGVRDDLLAAVARLQRSGAAAPQWGWILSVIGAKPGVGVTTVACNLAFALAGQHPDRVALAELGASVPELALDLDLEPPHSFSELAASWNRLDPTLMRQALVRHPARLSVLAYKAETLAPATLEPVAARQILVLLRAMFDFTVLDLGHTPDAACVEALGLAHKVVLVVNLDVPSLRLSRQFLERLDRDGLTQDKLHVVANRYGQRKQFPWKRAQEALGLPIREWIPDDPGRVNQALNQGQPLLQSARRSGIARSFQRLVGQLNGPDRQVNGLAG
jgi:pilus assembly protein CpaE